MPRGNNYYTKPIYDVPRELPLKLVVLMLVARKRQARFTVDIVRPLKQYIPHRRIKNIASGYLFKLKYCVDRIDKGVYRVNNNGWRKLDYYDRRVCELPEPLRSQIIDKLEAFRRRYLNEGLPSRLIF